MRDKLQIGIEQSKRRRAKYVLCRVNPILAHRITFSRACFRRANQSHVIMEGIDRRLRALKRVARAPTTRSIVVNRIFSSNKNLPRLLVKRHTPQSATGIFQNTRRLALSPPRDHECQDSARRRDVKHSHSPGSRLKTGNGLLRLEDNALARTTIVNQIAADNRHRPVRETDCYLREIVDDRKGRYLDHPLAFSLLPAYHLVGRRTGNCLLAFCTDTVDKHFGPPSFFSVSRAQTFSTGSFDRSSATVTSNDVPPICFICVMDPASCALNERKTRKDEETMCTKPSTVPRKRFADPVQRLDKSLYRSCPPSGECQCESGGMGVLPQTARSLPLAV